MHATTVAAAAASCAFPVCRCFARDGASTEKVSFSTGKQRPNLIPSSSLLGYPARLFPKKKHHQRLRRKTPSRQIKAVRALRLLTNPDDFQVGRFLGSYGFIKVTSYSSFQSGGPQVGGDYLSHGVDSLRVQDVGEGNVKIRLYEGKIVKGPLKGTGILFKVYPGQLAGGVEADMMAANELNAHASLQEDAENISQNIQTLLGAFETKTGEQWLAFQSAGKYSAADYAKFASERVSKDIGKIYWYPYEREQTFTFRRYFVVNMLNGIMRGLAFLHDHNRLHQSLGPASVILNTTVEKEAMYLVPRLRDLAFSVDIRYSSLEASPASLSESLWRRANAAGAFSPLQKRAFGIADDM